MSEIRILVVDDETDLLEVCEDTLGRLEGVEVVTENDPRRAAERFGEEGFDLLITDIRMPGMTGLQLLEKAREVDAELPVVMMTAFPAVETAVEAMKLGALDYITKPFHPEDLNRTVMQLLEHRRLKDENRLLQRQLDRPFAFDDLVGRSPQMRNVFDLIERVATTDVDVLIIGETGTGKELVARAIHRRSSRVKGPFVPVDCGAIPETLIESEFFGFERGAFTGANTRTIGLMEYAHKGTFFLDEIAELPLLLQAKLLRALQERKVRRLGGKREIVADVRVVAATAKDLDVQIKEGLFREDLYFRINVVRIDLPPLRDRGEDVKLLAEEFLERYSREMGKEVDGLDPDVVEIFREYRWPGNVRELQNIIRRGIALTRSSHIQVEDLPEKIVSAAGGHLSAKGGSGFFQQRDRQMARFEQEYLRDLLERHDGDVTAAAKEAQIPRGTCYRLMKNHGLRASEFRE
ncbi:MAG: sigma-54 dependent transcriptional regulator [Planctomycetota bacterium]